MEQQELSSEQCQTDAKQRCPSKGGSLEQDCGQARDQESKGGELARREALQTELGRNEGAAPDDGDQDGEGCVPCVHNRICRTLGPVRPLRRA